jgi:quinol monooxygenase YgiN
MTKQVQFTAEITIAEGKVNEFKNIIPAFIESSQKNEPDLKAFQVYLNADETKAYFVEWYRNSEAVLAHWMNVKPLLEELLKIVRYTRLEYYGNLTKAVEDALKPLMAPIFRYHGGFIRGEIITPRTEVPDEIIGAWENGSIDFELWEKYQQGTWAGAGAVQLREAMVFILDGDARYLRYELAPDQHEVLIDVTGTVTFNQDATFTFYPVEGRKRFYDTREPQNNQDTALTATELADPKLALTRGYAYNGAADPPALQITVAGSEPYNWFKKPYTPPRTEVPDELVGSWADGSFDFELWENYQQGYWSGKYSVPVREAMIFHKNGDAKYHRYETVYVFYEVLVDCTGTVTFNGDGTFTFYPVRGRKRYYDKGDASRNYDRPLTNKELTDHKLGGRRGYEYNGATDPPTIIISVPSSPPYNWYKKA